MCFLGILGPKEQKKMMLRNINEVKGYSWVVNLLDGFCFLPGTHSFFPGGKSLNCVQVRPTGAVGQSGGLSNVVNYIENCGIKYASRVFRYSRKGRPSLSSAIQYIGLNHHDITLYITNLTPKYY